MSKIDPEDLNFKVEKPTFADCIPSSLQKIVSENNVSAILGTNPSLLIPPLPESLKALQTETQRFNHVLESTKALQSQFEMLKPLSAYSSALSDSLIEFSKIAETFQTSKVFNNYLHMVKRYSEAIDSLKKYESAPFSEDSVFIDELNAASDEAIRTTEELSGIQIKNRLSSSIHKSSFVANLVQKIITILIFFLSSRLKTKSNSIFGNIDLRTTNNIENFNVYMSNTPNSDIGFDETLSQTINKNINTTLSDYDNK